MKAKPGYLDPKVIASGHLWPVDEHEKRWHCRGCGRLVLGQVAMTDDERRCPACK